MIPQQILLGCLVLVALACAQTLVVSSPGLPIPEGYTQENLSPSTSLGNLIVYGERKFDQVWVIVTDKKHCPARSSKSVDNLLKYVCEVYLVDI